MTPCVDMCTQKCLPTKSLSTNSLPWHIPKQNVLQDFKMRLAFELYFRSKLVCYALRILYTCTASLATGFLYSTSDLYCLNSGESILGEFLLYFTNLLFLQSLLTWVGAVVLSTLFSLLRKFLPQSPMESGKSNNHPNFSQPGKIVDAMLTILMAMMATQRCMSRFLRVDDSGKHHMPTWSRLNSKEPFI